MIFLKKVNFKELSYALIILILYLFIVPNIVIVFCKAIGFDLTSQKNFIFANLSIYVILIILLFIIYRDSLKVEFKIFKDNIRKNFIIGCRNWFSAFFYDYHKYDYYFICW